MDSINKSGNMNKEIDLKDGIMRCQIMHEDIFNKFSEFNVGSYI
jgi:hypothetical protein